MIEIPVHRIPIRSNKAKGRARAVVVAHAIVDDDMGHLADYFWTLHSGYASRRERHRTIFMHFDVIGRRFGFDASHENANKLDNRRRNLRFATRSENVLNPNDGIRRNRRSCPYRGVTRDDQRRSLARPWRGKVQVAGKTYATARCATAEEARDALVALRERLGIGVREWPR